MVKQKLQAVASNLRSDGEKVVRQARQERGGMVGCQPQSARELNLVRYAEAQVKVDMASKLEALLHDD
ncbi:hypothetical protein ACSZNO_21180 [Aeromonas veronii]